VLVVGSSREEKGGRDRVVVVPDLEELRCCVSFFRLLGDLYIPFCLRCSETAFCLSGFGFLVLFEGGECLLTEVLHCGYGMLGIEREIFLFLFSASCYLVRYPVY
jgi:hypothetical protein